MIFDEVLAQARELLQSKGRVAYRALKRRFDLDDEYLEDLKAELIDAEHVAQDEDGKVLVWTGASPVAGSEFQVPRSPQPLAPHPPIVFGTNFDEPRTPCAPSLCLSPTAGREDLKSREAGKLRSLFGPIPSPLVLIITHILFT